MTTPLIILALLVLPALVGLIAEKVGGVRDGLHCGGLSGLVFAFSFFASGHFLMPELLVDMLPIWVPVRDAIVIVTGLIEAAIALSLLIRRFRVAAGWMATVILVAFFPANIYAALNAIGPGGHQWGPEYLLIRAPLQIFLLAWVYWFVLRASSRNITENGQRAGRTHPNTSVRLPGWNCNYERKRHEGSAGTSGT